jgi:3-phenylpropionate/cinnamic acid dioxygenase small subunit
MGEGETHGSQALVDRMTEPSTLETRIQRVEADLAIRAILVDYATFLDARNYAPYVALFTPDGEWENHNGHYKGHDAIMGMLTSQLGPDGTPNPNSYHLITNVRVTLGDDGETATASARFHFVMRDREGGAPRIILGGTYDDQLVRQGDGQWKIRRRLATDLMPSPEEWNRIMAERMKK